MASLQLSSLLLLFLNALSHFNRCYCYQVLQRYLYVDSIGTANDICDASHPCGSLNIALRNAALNNTLPSSISPPITIYVNGHYALTSNDWDPSIDCFNQIFGNISIVFNASRITALVDWYPFFRECFAYNADPSLYQLRGQHSSVTFTHLVYDHSQLCLLHASDGDDDSMAGIHCHRCSFFNLDANAIFMSLAHTSSFVDCVFENITISAASFISIAATTDDVRVSLQNCTLRNIHTVINDDGDDTAFIGISSHIQHNIDINASQIMFNQSSAYDDDMATRFIAVHTNTKFVNSRNSISITSSLFEGAITVIATDDVADFNVRMDDLVIRSPQYLQSHQQSHAIHIGRHSACDLQRVWFETLLQCNAGECELPVGFLYNSGHCNVSNTTMTSDYRTLSQLQMQSIRFKSVEDLNTLDAHFIAAIFNDVNGELHLNDVAFLDAAAVEFLYNVRGTVYISNLQTKVRTNDINMFGVGLRPLKLFTNYDGELRLQHSEVMDSAIGFELYYGSLQIVNSTLASLDIAVQTMYVADSIAMKGVYFSNIDQIAAAAVHGLHLAAHNISIVDSVFEFPASVGLLICDSVGVLQTKYMDDANQQRQIVLSGNQFIAHLASLSYNVGLGYIVILAPYSVTVTFNAFVFESVDVGNQSSESDAHTQYQSSVTPWLYVNTNTDDNCMASNTFHDYALLLQNGSVFSCLHPQLQLQSAQCLSSLGAMNRLYVTQHTFFIHTGGNETLSAITLNSSASSSSWLVLDDAFFVGFASIPIAITGHNHNLLVLQSQFDNSGSFYVPFYCQASCYEVVHSNHAHVRQLQLSCDDDHDHDLNESAYMHMVDISQTADVESVSSWFAQRVVLSANDVFPGGVLSLNYTILDMDGHPVDSSDAIAIQIALQSSVLRIDQIVYIDVSSDSCRNCEFDLATNHDLTVRDVGRTFTLHATVIGDVLLVHDLNVSIVACPSEYVVSSNTSICLASATESQPQPSFRYDDMQLILTVIGAAVVCLLVILAYAVCSRKCHPAAPGHNHDAWSIKHPLVVLIGIGMYENIGSDSCFVDGDFPDLSVEIDLENAVRFCKYMKYKMFAHATKLQWTADEVMAVLHDAAKECSSEEEHYDALIVMVSSHTFGDSIVTTDLKLVSKQLIQRTCSRSYPELRQKPRFFIFDGCTSSQPHVQRVLRPNVTVNASIEEESLDENVIEVHADSSSVQLKMNEMDGSYLLHEVQKRVLFDLEQSPQSQCLADILSQLNASRLHCKQSMLRTTFHSERTQFIRFMRNNNSNNNTSELATASTTDSHNSEQFVSPPIVRLDEDSEDVKSGHYSVDIEHVHESARRTGISRRSKLLCTHMPIERVHDSDTQLNNASVYASDRVSTKSSARRRDIFIRKKSSVPLSQQVKSGQYRIVQMQDIEEDDDDSSEPSAADMQHIAIARNDCRKQRSSINIDVEMTELDAKIEEEEPQIYSSRSKDIANDSTTVTTTTRTIHTAINASSDDDEEVHVTRQNVIQATDTDTDSEMDACKSPLKFSPQRRESKESVQL